MLSPKVLINQEENLPEAVAAVVVEQNINAMQ